MGLVSAKCPNCGATIQLDSSRKEGFCLYCGSKVRVEEAIKTVKIDRSKDIRNYLNMAAAAVEAGNGDEALEYSNKALEVDSENADAWYLKMRAIQVDTAVYAMKIEEILGAGSKAISCSNTTEMTNKVYAFYLDTCCYDLELCMKEIGDGYDSFRENFYFLNDKIAKNFSNAESYILSLRKAVPDDAIADNEELQEHTKQLANLWNDYRNSIIRSYRNEGKVINYRTLSSFPAQLDIIQQGLPVREKIRMADMKTFFASEPVVKETSVRETIHTIAGLAVIFFIALMVYGVSKFNAHLVLLSFIGLVISIPVAIIMNAMNE